jgi:hypothetical protein
MRTDRAAGGVSGLACAVLLAGLIHLLPLPGILGADWLARLYGVAVADPGTELLLRHRAVLFGLLGALLIASALRLPLRPLAIGAGLASTAAFLLLAGDPRLLGAEVLRVWWVDLVAVACLLVAAALNRPGRPPAGS